jgi:hypothetical protein
MTTMRKRKKKVKTASSDRFHGFARRGAPGAAALLLLSVISLFAPAQEKKDYALIYGTVWGADNRAVAGVPIKVQRVGDKKPKWDLISDPRGEFAQRVPTGDNEYIIIADIKVPKGGTKPQTKVHVYANERVDISLHFSR